MLSLHHPQIRAIQANLSRSLAVIWYECELDYSETIALIIHPGLQR